MAMDEVKTVKLQTAVRLCATHSTTRGCRSSFRRVVVVVVVAAVWVVRLVNAAFQEVAPCKQSIL